MSEVDSIVSPGTDAGPLARARSRVATVSFALCVSLLVLCVYVAVERRTSIRDFLAAHHAVSHWESALGRLNAIAGSDHPHVSSALWLTFWSLCVTSQEQQRISEALSRQKSGNVPLGINVVRNDIAGRRTFSGDFHLPPSDSSKRGSWCTTEYENLKLSSRSIREVGAKLNITELENPSGTNIDRHLSAFLEPLPAVLRDLLFEHYSPQQFYSFAARWLEFRAQRTWVLTGIAVDSFPIPNRAPNRYLPGDRPEFVVHFNAGTLGDPAALFGEEGSAAWPSGSRFVNELAPTVELQLSRAALAQDPTELRTLILKYLGDATQYQLLAIQKMSQTQEVSSIFVVKLSSTLILQLVLIPAVLSYLLFWIYATRLSTKEYGSAFEAAADDFWFPKLGSPADPLALTAPNSPEGFVSRLIWLLFHLSPLVLAFVASVLRLDPVFVVGTESATPVRTELVHWFNAVLLCILFWSQVRVTAVETRVTSTRYWWTFGVGSGALACAVVSIAFPVSRELFSTELDASLPAAVTLVMTAIVFLERKRIAIYCLASWTILLLVMWEPFVARYFYTFRPLTDSAMLQ